MRVRFKLDENMPRGAESLLLDAGHEVHTVLAENLGGRPDTEILDVCQRERRILVTFDLDLSDIRAHPPQTQHGVWILRPVTQSVTNTLGLLRGALGLLKTESPRGRLWIVEHGRVRVRG